MTATMTQPLSETFESYALGLLRKESLPSELHAEMAERRKDKFLRLLKAHGIKGWPERGTFYTRQLSDGCKPCLSGEASHLSLTTLCNRDCFFCFNPKPRKDVLSVHGRSVDSLDEAILTLKSLGIKSVGIGGGEPLLFPKRVFEVIATLKKNLGSELWIDLYTNADRLTLPILKELKAAGVSGLRIDLAARKYDAEPVRLAREVFNDVEIEMPAIPEDKKIVRDLMPYLDELGVKQLILHELFASAANIDSLKKRGYRASSSGSPDFRLTWSPVAQSEETVYGHLLYALIHKFKMSVYYCSCRTQDLIAENALKRQKLGTVPK